MSIQVLSPQLANQIAAGEVVERPASVIKELIENCIDSGADSLDIEIEQGGCKLIRVRDNGCGIAKDELPLALARHATSKISSLDDLSAIISLGFRGEALASISSVSRLTLTSRPKEQSEAWQVYAEGREMNAIVKPAAHPIGTTVEVLDLFYNTPARRRFLRTEKTEFTHIDEVVRRVALARPDMAINLSHNGKLVKQYRAAKSSEQIDKRVAAVCGLAFIQHAIKLAWQHDDLTIKGWVANVPGCDLQYFYVNGRIVKDRLLNHAIRQAYQHQLKGDNIAYVIYLELDPHQVDVNVHPAKHEVRFHEARLVHDFVHQAILMGLDIRLHEDNEDSTDDNIISTVLVQNRQAAGSNVFEQSITSGSLSANNHYQPTKPNSSNKGHVREQQAYQQLLNAARADQTIAHHQPKYQDVPVQKTLEQTLFPERKEPLVLPTIAAEMMVDSATSAKFGRALTVYQKQYAILEDGQQLQLLSLPIAQQQLYTAKLLEQRHKPAETLLIPLKLLLSKKEQKLFTDHYDLFVALNIKFSIEKDKLQLNEVPLLLRNMNWQQLLPLLIDYLNSPSSLHQVVTEEQLAFWLAKQYYLFCLSHKTEWTLTEVVCLLTELEQVNDAYFDKKIFLQLIDFSSLIKNFVN